MSLTKTIDEILSLLETTNKNEHQLYEEREDKVITTEKKNETRETSSNYVLSNDYNFKHDFDFDTVRDFLLQQKQELEKEYQMKIIYMVERSSRVWGTSHPKSDFDVKAIMCYSPRQYYSPTKERMWEFKRVFGPRSKQSQVGANLDLELTCIDILNLGSGIFKNDPNIFEIFHSPVIYWMDSKITPIRSIIDDVYNWRRLAAHYSSWAYSNLRQFTDNKKKRMREKPLKTTFAVLRGILCCEYLLTYETHATIPLFLPFLIDHSKILDWFKIKDLAKEALADLKSGATDFTLRTLPLKEQLEFMCKELDQQLDSKKNCGPSAPTPKQKLLLDEIVFNLIENN
ncbi:putative Cytosolic Protein [Reticulomyxa filosa]|uniref:Putative Cytosolic Protein n=1 Tax=Reticulomyxa filosa TaxID=46433 RepID=X6PCU9_RETFI|nr:putative Cytosolic Protein [Reticulomyxa filosa]|eukprot:ETO35913.1 putative Cytosolic Protein [Reticulomyxa filosa]